MEKAFYEQVGLKVGLEVHRQLDTSHKLFCKCPTSSRPSKGISFIRRLRPTQSELGQVDPAALFEFRKGKLIEYEADVGASCLVEMDEEPPGPINSEAVEIALTVARLLKADVVDEIHVMRKVVIDGSNTTGFQRTCVVALGGEIEVQGKTIPIQQISLEEDAARKLKDEGMKVSYKLDRLCIPLIEVSTAPVLTSPSEVERVAHAIGRVLRSTWKVKRGLGSVRQDLNISIKGGALVEVKGVQELELLGKVVEYEAQRQLALLKIRDELRARQVGPEDLKEDFVDLGDIFRDTQCKVIKTALERGGVVKGLKLSGFAGLLGRELVPGLRLGKEMADRAIFWGRVGGIFHTDELPGYGIAASEVEALKAKAGAGGMDAVVIVADMEDRVEDALRAALERAREALVGVPEETRMATPDGVTRYMRPRPGAARMYPETDVPPMVVDAELLEKVEKNLPPSLDELTESIAKKYGIGRKLSEELVEAEHFPLFEGLVMVGGVAPSFIATVLAEGLKSLRRDGVPVANLTDDDIKATFEAVREGLMAKEAVLDVLAWLANNPGSSVQDAVKALGIRMLSPQEVEALVQKRVGESMELIRKLGQGAFGTLMGQIMREVRGSADPNLVSQKLREKIEQALGQSG